MLYCDKCTQVVDVTRQLHYLDHSVEERQDVLITQVKVGILLEMVHSVL